MTETSNSRVVRRASDLLGIQQLADRLNVSRTMLESWMAGTGTPPPHIYFELVDMVQRADPAYGRLGDEPLSASKRPLSSSRSIRAFVVDDYLDAAEALAGLLQILGCKADFVTDSRTAMAAAAPMDPHIVFIDIGMPELNGFELATIFRTRYGQSIRLIAATAYGGTGVHVKSRDAGFDAHIQKPVDVFALDRMLNRVFGD